MVMYRDRPSRIPLLLVFEKRPLDLEAAVSFIHATAATSSATTYLVITDVSYEHSRCMCVLSICWV